MAAAAAAGGPTRPPTTIEDFLWNIHSVLAAQPGLLPIDSLKDAYSKHLGHKCAIERFLVVGEGGISATLKRIPHIVSISSDNGTTVVKATQQPDINKQQLMETDASYRRELIKKNAAAKAAAKTKAATGRQPAAATAKAAALVANAVVTPSGTEESSAAVADAKEGVKRPAEVSAAGAGNAKKQRGEANNDAEGLVQVVRVLQNLQKACAKNPFSCVPKELTEYIATWHSHQASTEDGTAEGEAAPGHPQCRSEEYCQGIEDDTLIRHYLNGKRGDIYCATCWASFLMQNPFLVGKEEC